MFLPSSRDLNNSIWTPFDDSLPCQHTFFSNFFDSTDKITEELISVRNGLHCRGGH